MTPIRQHGQRPASGGAPRVVIVGAGFGGLAAVRRLARAGVQTTLIDRSVCAAFQPLLYQVATAGLAGSGVACPVRGITRRHHAAFRHGGLTGLDPPARQVALAGTLAGLRDAALPALFPEIGPARAHITPTGRPAAPLASFHPAPRGYARRRLIARGAEARLGSPIAGIIPGKAVPADGSALASDITVWAAGVAAPSSPLPRWNACWLMTWWPGLPAREFRWYMGRRHYSGWVLAVNDGPAGGL